MSKLEHGIIKNLFRGLTLTRDKLQKNNQIYTGIALRKDTHKLLVRIYKKLNNDQHKEEGMTRKDLFSTS